MRAVLPKARNAAASTEFRDFHPEKTAAIYFLWVENY
jgi:hypothetical protein